MRVNPDISNIIHPARQEQRDKSVSKGPLDSDQTVYDVVSVENQHASDTRLDSVDQAKDLLSHIVDKLPSSPGVHNLNVQRLIGLFQ